METKSIMPVADFCLFHQIELSFILSLHESGLINIIINEQTVFLPVSEIGKTEKLIRLYQEMDINVEGIEAIVYLLDRIESLQQQVVQLQNELSVYDNSAIAIND